MVIAKETCSRGLSARVSDNPVPDFPPLIWSNTRSSQSYVRLACRHLGISWSEAVGFTWPRLAQVTRRKIRATEPGRNRYGRARVHSGEHHEPAHPRDDVRIT